MRVRLAILDEDMFYINRMAEVFQTRYAEDVEVYSFTNLEAALYSLNDNKTDVFVANEKFDIDVSKIPARCGFAYLTEQQGIESIREQVAIPKFQRVELIYKQILSLYSEKAENLSGLKHTESGCKVIAFMPAAGGVGASTMAAACATAFAEKRKRVMYLNFEIFGSSDIFFSGEGQFDMSDMIYALKSKRANISLKLKSNVRKSQSGVCFFSKTKVALDMMELGLEEKLQLISVIRTSGDYDYLILDLESTLNKENIELFKQSQSIVYVSDGSVIANDKLLRMCEALAIMDKGMEVSFINRMAMVYNKFSNKSGQVIQNDMMMIGGAPRFEQATVGDIVAKLATMPIFDKLL